MVAVVAVALAGGAAIAVVLARGAAPEPCVASAPRGWDPATRARIRPALVAAGADPDRVLGAIDARATATATFGADACRAARTRDPGDRARALRRQVCLEETWAKARASIAGLVSTDREYVRNALDVLIQVLPAERCVATRMPSRASPPPTERASAVDAAERTMLELRRDSRKVPAERLAGLDLAASQVTATEYPPVLARMHWDRGNVLTELGRHAEAGTEFEQALALAVAAADDELTARIAIERLRLAFMAGQRDLTAVRTAAQTAVDHLDNPAIAAELDVAIAMAEIAVGRDAEAIELLRRALAIYDRIAIADHAQVVTALQMLSSPLQGTGDLTGAQAVLDRAVEVGRKRYGEDSVDTWYLVSNRAANRAYLGDVQASADELAIAVDHLRTADPADPRVAHIRTQLCGTQLQLTGTAALPACRDAVTATSAAMGPDHPQLIWTLTLLGQGQLLADDLAAAATTLDRAVKIGERATIGPNDLAFARAYLAIALRTSDPRRARRLADAVIVPLVATENTEPVRYALANAFPELARKLEKKP